MRGREKRTTCVRLVVDALRGVDCDGVRSLNVDVMER